MRKVYENLTQSCGENVCYLRSTDVETSNWTRLLYSIPDDWLYQWHKGNTIILHEVTTKQTGGKIIRIAIPVIKDVLNFLLFDKPPICTKYYPTYKLALSTLKDNTSLRKKFTYWKGHVETVRLEVSWTVVTKEPNLIKH